MIKRIERMPAPELVDQYSGVEITEMPKDDRIQAKILARDNDHFRRRRQWEYSDRR